MVFLIVSKARTKLKWDHIVATRHQLSNTKRIFKIGSIVQSYEVANIKKKQKPIKKKNWIPHPFWKSLPKRKKIRTFNIPIKNFQAPSKFFSGYATAGEVIKNPIIFLRLELGCKKNPVLCSKNSNSLAWK